jgi:hypothetical protein
MFRISVCFHYHIYDPINKELYYRIKKGLTVYQRMLINMCCYASDTSWFSSTLSAVSLFLSFTAYADKPWLYDD